MKKNLIAIAVASAISLPALAQNVSISGYGEAGWNRATSTGGATTNSIASGVFGSSRLTISGSEDLGGGLKAGFRLESGVNYTTGKVGYDDTAANNGTSVQETLFSRGAEVNVSGAFGMVRFGKFDHLGGENTDINVVGNIALATGISSTVNNGTAANVEMGSDRDGTVAYRTPAMFGGFFEVAHTPKGSITATNAAAAQGALTSLYYEGTVAPGLNVRLGYATQKADGNTSTTNDTAKRTGAGASYDFGIASASIHHASQTIITQRKNTETTLSVNVPLGNGLDLRGVYQDFAVSDSEALDYTETTIGLAKALSKRTSLVGAYIKRDFGSTTADTGQAFVGVAHSF
jgi:predicted porin